MSRNERPASREWMIETRAIERARIAQGKPAGLSDDLRIGLAAATFPIATFPPPEGMRLTQAGDVPAQPGNPATGAAPAPAPAAAQPTPSPNANMRLSPAGLEALFHREAQPGVSEHTHFTGPVYSGVTLGAGYDMARRTSEQIESDLTAIGVDRATAHVLAQGSGRRGPDAEAFARAHRNDLILTEQQQRDLLGRVITSYEQSVRSNVQVELNQSQFDAIVSYDYNVGDRGLRNSGVLRLLNSNQLGAVPAELNRANAPLLVGRRAAEANQFQGRTFLAPPYR